jgi:integrase
LLLRRSYRQLHHRGTIGGIPPIENGKVDFYDFDDYERLCTGAAKVGTRELVLVRLGGDAGLRRGEIMALQWGDVDFTRRQLTIEQAAWRHSAKYAKANATEQVSIAKPKGGKGRVVKMTDALFNALKAHRHLQGDHVLSIDGALVPGHILRDWLEAAQRRAGLKVCGALHKLRHTFCSHLAMRGATLTEIQKLAGHADLKMTMRYTHLMPASLDAAIDLLNAPAPAWARAAGAAE